MLLCRTIFVENLDSVKKKNVLISALIAIEIHKNYDFDAKMLLQIIDDQRSARIIVAYQNFFRDVVCNIIS